MIGRARAETPRSTGIGSLLMSSLGLACGDVAQRKDPLDLDERVFLLDHADGFTPVVDTTVTLVFVDREVARGP